MKNNTAIAILDATLSSLIAQRDDMLVQLDLIINKNGLNVELSAVVAKSVELFTQLSNIESAIDNVKHVIETNKQPNEDLLKLQSALIELQKNTKSENKDGHNS